MLPHRLAGLLLLLLVAVPQGAFGQPASFTPREENPEEYPGGPGREEAFYACTACHHFTLVAQQGQTRAQWSETLDLMTERHGMPPLEGKDREVVLGYLESAFSPKAPAGGRGWQNPFAK